MNDSMDVPDSAVAIIGLGCRFPKSPNPDAFWSQLRDGEELIRRFSRQELLGSGLDSELIDHPDYVPSRATLEDVDLFDALFFEMGPHEAAITDPQHRLFLECAWEALEDAGYDPSRGTAPIGVFAGAGLSAYAQAHLYEASATQTSRDLELQMASDKEHLTGRVAYKLDLRGPAVSVQTACSTSLVAVHMACQSLVCGDCDLALAGGVSVPVPQEAGYLHTPGSILSPDGHCRAFDAAAGGTLAGSGLGIVVLKPLDEALADGDRIRAIILGSAINNDGANRIGYTAPGVDGQAAVVREAQAIAGVDPATITYVEAHGTGTALGDPIEVAALTQAFGLAPRKSSCAIGSVKTNVGHLGVAAGVTGLIKTVLALEHRMLPPSLHYRSANPEIDFASGPFHVNDRLRAWPSEDGPRRAGVSSFGMSGTNAHVVLEEAPLREETHSSRPEHLLVLSGRTPEALEEMTTRLGQHLEDRRTLHIADVAFTLQVGRKAFEYRRVLPCRDIEDALTAVADRDGGRWLGGSPVKDGTSLVFLFPGQGSQHSQMGRALYEQEPTFRREIDDACEILEPHLGLDLRRLLYPVPEEEEEADRKLKRTAFSQPALFVVEYALARMWMEWGIRPQAMIGHSVGEYVAACLAGVFRPRDALRLLARRGQLLDELPPGGMLAVPLAAAELESRLGEDLSLAAINGVSLSVVSGPVERVKDLAEALAEEGVEARRLRTSHAFHSAMVEPALEAFRHEVETIELSPPDLPYIGNVTGSWIKASEATDPDYWVRHLRQTVLFAEGLDKIFESGETILLEVGPGRTLIDCASRHPRVASSIQLASLPGRHRVDEGPHLLTTLGRLWLAGQAVDWDAYHAYENRCRVGLPTYPFERRRYRVHSRLPGTSVTAGITHNADANEVADKTVITDRVSPPHERPPGLDNPFVAASSGAQKRLASLWQELMAVEEVGIHDDFAELGGDSLLATRMLSRLAETFGIRISMKQFANASTVSGLAELVDSTQDARIENPSHSASIERSQEIEEGEL